MFVLINLLKSRHITRTVEKKAHTHTITYLKPTQGIVTSQDMDCLLVEIGEQLNCRHFGQLGGWKTTRRDDASMRFTCFGGELEETKHCFSYSLGPTTFSGGTWSPRNSSTLHTTHQESRGQVPAWAGVCTPSVHEALEHWFFITFYDQKPSLMHQPVVDIWLD